MASGNWQVGSKRQRPELTAFLNGDFMPQSRVVREMNQAGFGSSGGFYDNERTFSGNIFRLEDHLHRLYNGLDYTKIDPGVTFPEMVDITLRVLQANIPHLDAGEEFLVSQIVSPCPDPDGSINVAVYCQFLEMGHFAAHYTRGIRVTTPGTYNIPSRGQPSGKTHVAMALMMNEKGHITECQGGNFMFVRGGRIRLPDRRHVLPGVSMKTVLELAESVGVPIDEGEYSPEDVYESQEAFVTSTRFCLAPAVSLNGLDIHTGLMGPITESLLDAWKEMVGLDFVQQAISRAGELDGRG